MWKGDSSNVTQPTFDLLRDHGVTPEKAARASVKVANELGGSYVRTPTKALEKTYQKDKSSGCFITTAVCKTLDKPDDCEELTKFRHFRDTFMQGTAEMRAEVQEYYEVAPKICDEIEKSGEKNASEKYANIWETSLKPAFEFLNLGNNEKTHELYRKMVLGLRKSYLEKQEEKQCLV
jgi:hypothetical protein